VDTRTKEKYDFVSLGIKKVKIKEDNREQSGKKRSSCNATFGVERDLVKVCQSYKEEGNRQRIR